MPIKRHHRTEPEHYAPAIWVPPGGRVTVVRARPDNRLGCTVYCRISEWHFPSGGEEEAPEVNRMIMELHRYTGSAHSCDKIDIPIRGWMGHVACDEVELVIENPSTSTITYLVSGGAFDGDPSRPLQLIDFVASDFNAQDATLTRLVVLEQYSHEFRAFGEGTLAFYGAGGTPANVEWFPVSGFFDWCPLHRRAYQVIFIPGGGFDYCRLEVR